MYVVLVIAKILTIIGGLNWGLIGVFEFNLVDAIFGEMTVASQVTYIVIGVAAMVTIIDLFWDRRSDRYAQVLAADGPRD